LSHSRHNKPTTSMSLYEVLNELWNHGTKVDWSPYVEGLLGTCRSP
jgi:hypothetical protein